MGELATGGCQCGRIRYAVALDNDHAYLCHCRMCQRATGGVSIAFTNVSRSAVTWTTREPDRFHSSAIAERGYCRECGTPLTFEYLKASEKLDLTVGSFDEPGRFRPTAHFGTESLHEAWLDTRSLPRQRSDEYAPLLERWKAADAKPR
jgi:hypothetical protein